MEKLVNRKLSERIHDNLTLRKNEMKRGPLQNYRPWNQLNSSVDKFQQTLQMKIGYVAIDESEFGHIEKHVETFKN